MAKKKKIGLALGSGGARGFCHLGILKVFTENGIPIDCLSGCSMGALVGGCFAAGASVEKMIKMSPKITQIAIMDVNFSNRKAGLIKGQRAMRLVQKMIGKATFADCSIPFAATATDLRSGKLVTFTEGDLGDAIRASISIPGAFHVYEDPEGGDIYVDGGVLERIPIRAVRDLGADIVIAVDAIGGIQEGFDATSGFINVLQRSVNLMDWRSTEDAIKSADFLITPEQGFKNTFVFKDNEESIQAGITAAEKALPELRKLLEL